MGYCKLKQEALDSTLWINAMKGRWTCRKIDNKAMTMTCTRSGCIYS